MKFIVNSQALYKQLQSISGIITNSNTVPIISCFHFQLEDGKLTVRATDLETTLVVTLDVETASLDGLSQVAIQSKLLLDILKSLDDVPLTFTVDDTTYAIELTHSAGKYSLAGMDASVFPAMPQVEGTVSVSMPASALVSAINKTVFAASNDEMRQQMTGIFCQLSPEGATFVATDAHKLVRYKRSDVKADEQAEFIFPKKPITLVKKILEARREEFDVTLSYNRTNATFAFDNVFIACRLVDGKYPNFEAAIPKENPNKLTIDRVSFLNTLRRVGLFANQSTCQVRLSLAENEIVVSAEDIEFSNNAQEKLPCDYKGDTMDIGFNSRFLIEMLTNLDTEHILIEMSQPSRAGIIFPVNDGEDTSENILMLVMPVMLAN
ncbi:MAG: DNA polymerase III subunit beta [Bacteroidales bacterium]|nr:DNA polymerase III subunit beta [Bacteroidales bacterium]